MGLMMLCRNLRDSMGDNRKLTSIGNQPRAKARGFVGDALGYAISLLSRFDGRPRAAIPPRAEPSDSHGLTDSSRS